MPQPDDIKRIDIKEFREFGWVQEINRLMLHPAGLALEVNVDDDGNETLGGVWDYREDAEGVLYSDGVMNSDKAERVAEAMCSKAEHRFKYFGTNVQVIP